MNDTFDSRLHKDGYFLIPAVLAEHQVREAIARCEAVFHDHADDPALLKGEDGSVSGARNLLQLFPDVVNLLVAARPHLFRRLGPAAGVVRVLYFDKPPGRGWALPWHKDFNIAVRAHGAIGRFRKPTTKAGVPHVEAPDELLRRMLTVRIHLDDMTEDNGPLRVIPGSHENSAEERPPRSVHCLAGDALFMRPLLTHSSANSRPGCDRHRRILHFECAPEPSLPDGYAWFEFVPLQGPG